MNGNVKMSDVGRSDHVSGNVEFGVGELLFIASRRV